MEYTLPITMFNSRQQTREKHKNGIKISMRNPKAIPSPSDLNWVVLVIKLAVLSLDSRVLFCILEAVPRYLRCKNPLDCQVELLFFWSK